MEDRETKNFEYLVECFKTAREELQDRIRYRDKWLKYQLIAMVALLAIATGGEFLGIKIPQNLSVLFLSLPISLMISFSYFTENFLIGKLASYIASVSKAVEKVTSSDYLVKNWDNFYHDISSFGEYFQKYFRFVTLIISFALVPAILTVYCILLFDSRKYVWLVDECFSITLLVINLFVIVWFCLRDYHYRKVTGKEELKDIIEKG
jgi:hypothetical protein